jgi:hypothetical protein
MQFSTSRAITGLTVVVRIERDAGRTETLPLSALRDDPGKYMSAVAPEEPHTFAGDLVLAAGHQTEVLPFRVFEPHGHQ